MGAQRDPNRAQGFGASSPIATGEQLLVLLGTSLHSVTAGEGALVVC